MRHRQLLTTTGLAPPLLGLEPGDGLVEAADDDHLLGAGRRHRQQNYEAHQDDLDLHLDSLPRTNHG